MLDHAEQQQAAKKSKAWEDVQGARERFIEQVDVLERTSGRTSGASRKA
jgi:hypothetical protein